MALTKYTAQVPPVANQRYFIASELKRIELSTNSIIAILTALDVPIEIGPADSAGVGFRALRIPN